MNLKVRSKIRVKQNSRFQFYSLGTKMYNVHYYINLKTVQVKKNTDISVYCSIVDIKLPEEDSNIQIYVGVLFMVITKQQSKKTER